MSALARSIRLSSLVTSAVRGSTRNATSVATIGSQASPSVMKYAAGSAIGVSTLAYMVSIIIIDFLYSTSLASSYM